MNLLIGAICVGLILALLCLGVFVSYRAQGVPDLTTDGAFGVGAAVAAMLLVRGTSPLVATVCAAGAGALAGVATALIHTRLMVNTLLAGLLTSTGLYSISLFAMGSGNVPLAGGPSVMESADRLAMAMGFPDQLDLWGSTVSRASVAALVLMALVTTGVATLLGFLLTTELGLALRAAGNNPGMARAAGVDVNHMIVFGLALANGLVGLSGALLAQYEGLANIQMGVGALISGLGGVLVGEALVGTRTVPRWIAGVIAGSVIVRVAVAGAVRAGLHPSALKLVTSVLVLVVLVLPMLRRLHRQVPRHA